MTNDDLQDLDAKIARLAGKPKDYLRLTLRTARELFARQPEDHPKRADWERWIAALEAELAKP